jgi:peptidoglycan/xylan/chitin deacetylase (PgdA/CDA1 family)
MKRVDEIVQLLPLPLARVVLPGRVFVLCYHAISSRPLPHVRHLYDVKSPEQFEQDLKFLKENCHVASHDELVAHQKGSHRLPSGSVVITFDDGFSECHSIVRPLLLKYGLPCAFFICKSLIDNEAMMYRNVISLCLDRSERLNDDDFNKATARLSKTFHVRLDSRSQFRTWLMGLTYSDRAKLESICDPLAVDVADFLRQEQPYMTQRQILDLYDDGFAIGGHSCNHPELWLLEWQEATREIVDSCDAVRHLTGQKSVPFAFPFTGSSFDREKLAQVRRENDFLSLFYDANNLRLERDFIANRVGCDSPAGAEGGKSNVPFVMRQAYAFEPLRKVKRLIQGLPS